MKVSEVEKELKKLADKCGYRIALFLPAEKPVKKKAVKKVTKKKTTKKKVK